MRTMLDQLLKIVLIVSVSIPFILFPGLVLSHSYSLDKQPVSIEVNGKLHSFKHSPFLYQGHTMVPVRELGQHLDATVQWNEHTKTVTISKGQQVLTLQIHSNQALLNKKPIQLTKPVQLIEGKTYAPLRSVAETLEASVKWNPMNQLASIQTKMKLTPKQAEEVVRKKLDIPSGSKTIIEYDYDLEEGVYVVHVYKIVADHTATLGWYQVDASTGLVESMF